ncbi:MAG: TlyA family RNA methyltransferase [Pseudomonadota bacterium]
MGKRRLDQLLVESGYFESRARAQEAVRAGNVQVDGESIEKPSHKTDDSAKISIAGNVHPYVSRGGVKLEAALRSMKICAADRICLDLGASTGGFSDVLLRADAAKIYAVDVGTGQLHAKIANDPRIVNLEKTHAKDLSTKLIPEPVEIIVCDVSFISLKKALPAALALAAPAAQLVALVKPQFEVGRNALGKGGIVKPGRENADGVAENLLAWVNEQAGWTTTGYMKSPIRGGDGNQEFLIGAVKTA